MCPRFGGPVGAGYGHRLAWTYIFRRPPEDEAWEVIVDAHSGEVLAFQDVNHYIQQQITGGVYPLTNTEICPNPQICGTLQSGWPMPFADTGLASPNNFTNSAGIFDHAGGTSWPATCAPRRSTTTARPPSSSATRSSTRAAATSASGTPAPAAPPRAAAAPPTPTCNGSRPTTTTAT